MEDTATGCGNHGNPKDILPANDDVINQPATKKMKNNDDEDKNENLAIVEDKIKINENEKEGDECKVAEDGEKKDDTIEIVEEDENEVEVVEGEAEHNKEINVIDLEDEEDEEEQSSNKYEERFCFHFECSTKERLQKRKIAASSQSKPNVAERQIDTDFVLPDATQNITNKIKINVAIFDPAPCTIRPSYDLPVPGCPKAYSLKEPVEPYIIINVPDMDDFVNIWKVTGCIYFQPEPNWKEATAHVRLYYFLGTSNAQSWSHSHFITAPFEANEETKIDFVLSFDKRTYARTGKNENSWTSSTNPLFTESVHFVAIVCRDGFMKRSKEFTLRFSQKAILRPRQQRDSEPITIESD